MAKALFRILRRASPKPSILQPISCHPESIFSLPKHPSPPIPSWFSRNVSHGSVNLVLSLGKLKFETHETDPLKKEKWQTKKRLKQRRMREKEKRKSANKRDPRRLTVKGKKKKQKFANAEERIKSKLEKARIKEALLIERLKRYEVPKVQGPVVEPVNLTGEERFYMKKMAQKRSNYVPVGRRGVFGGVILNMHMHWKKHETVKVICKPCKPGQVHEYANEIARLSGGMPIQILGDDSIIFYRGKNYVQPKVMSPIDTLSKKKALEKSKYEQSLESVRRFIAIAEKELELYYRHVALYGDPNDRNPMSIFDGPSKCMNKSGKEMPRKENFDISTNEFYGPNKFMNESGKEMPRRESFGMSTNGFSFSPGCLSDTESDSTDEELRPSLSASEDDLEDRNCSVNEFDSYDDDEEENDFDSDIEESTGKFSVTRESSGTIQG